MSHVFCVVTLLSILASLCCTILAQACPWRFYGCIRSPSHSAFGGDSSLNCKVIYKRECDCVGSRARKIYCSGHVQMIIKSDEAVNRLMCDSACKPKPIWCPWQAWRDHEHQCGTQIRRREKCCHIVLKGHPLGDRCDEVDPGQRVQVRTRPCPPPLGSSETLLTSGSTSAVYFHIIVTAGGCCLLALLLITIYLKRHQLCARPRPPEASSTELRGLNGPVPVPHPLPLHPCLQARDPPRYEEISRPCTPPPPYDVVMAAMLQGKRQDSRGCTEI